jgi:site-specific recombinase XerD
MASIYKPTRVDPKTGKRVKYRCWRIAYIDQHGIRRSVKGFKDKDATEAKAREIERTVERQQAGVPIAPASKPMQEAIDAYLAELIRRGSPAAGPHVKEVRRQLERLQKDCRWTILKQITAATLTEWLNSRAIEDMAPATQNHYQGRLNEFLSWCVGQHFIEVNPIAHVRRAKVGKKGRRRLRRAYSLDEMQRLAGTAPEPRRTIYLIASLSGLRKNELRELQKQDSTPTGERPTWHLRAGIEKSGRGDKIPMLPECAELLEPIWQKAKAATTRLFDFMPRDHTLRADLKAAEIPLQDDRGRWADFHSFRYTFCTMLSKKLPIQQVKVLMRHSTISLTADLYHDLGLDDMRDEVCNLPRLMERPKPPDDTIRKAA